MPLETPLNESRYSLLVGYHLGHNSLLLCCREILQILIDFVFVFIEAFYLLDVSCIDPGQTDVFVKVQNMVVKPLAFDEEHLEFFSLSLVQTFLDDFALVSLDDLVKTTGTGILHTRLDLALLAFGARSSLVVFLHLILFTRFILQK
jgi:hypothetical protein